MWFFAFVSALGTLAIISILWPGLRGAPWVPTPMHVVRRMLDGPGTLQCGDAVTRAFSQVLE